LNLFKLCHGVSDSFAVLHSVVIYNCAAPTMYSRVQLENHSVLISAAVNRERFFRGEYAI
jgi:hypothetical protein